LTSQTATRTYQLESAAGSYGLPPLGGFSGSLSLPGANVPANTRLELTSAFQAPADAPSLADVVRRERATGTLSLYFYTSIQLSSTVTFPTLPGFSVTLPASVNPSGLEFFYAISNPQPSNGAEVQFRTEGPATVAGQIVTFAPSNTPLTLPAGQSYTIAFYAISAIAAATPSPTQTPQPVYTSLYSFKGGPDGSDPAAGVVALNGSLYGTTIRGGTSGNGTVFEVSTSGTEHVLYSFKGAPDGSAPAAGVVALNGAPGTIFEISPSGTERVVYSFWSAATQNLVFPGAALLDVNGILYGMAVGSMGSYGGVFAVNTFGEARVVHNFVLGDGAYPWSNLIDVNGVLYGTTDAGGANGNGTVFEVSTSGTEQVVHSFKGGADGALPHAGLVDVNGALYGATEAGGASGNGTVFEVSTSGTERVLYSFKGGTDGAAPSAGLVDLNGALYGTTYHGGTSGNGTVFEVALPQ
jgi:uncharacterized repeat protein (TIGR03803 family)